MFQITEAKLREVMKTTRRMGGKILEIPFLLCGIPWETVAQLAVKNSIKEIALCHFWPMNPDGSSVCGDPLGDEAEVQKALTTIENIIAAVKTLREGGVTVRFIDGPTWGGLGWDYTNLVPEVKRARVESFLRRAGIRCFEADLILAVEFLRGHEDKVIGNTKEMVEILKLVNFRTVRMHFDVFHSLEAGEDTAEMISYARRWIVYLHLHGAKRLAPGLPGDGCNWPAIVEACYEIESGIENIPVISEPFGEETCKENAALGDGLPPALPLPEYLKQAHGTLRKAGMMFS